MEENVKELISNDLENKDQEVLDLGVDLEEFTIEEGVE